VFGFVVASVGVEFGGRAIGRFLGRQRLELRSVQITWFIY
jgi:hypothetical protein